MLPQDNSSIQSLFNISIAIPFMENILRYLNILQCLPKPPLERVFFFGNLWWTCFSAVGSQHPEPGQPVARAYVVEAGPLRRHRHLLQRPSPWGCGYGCPKSLREAHFAQSVSSFLDARCDAARGCLDDIILGGEFQVLWRNFMDKHYQHLKMPKKYVHPCAYFTKGCVW